MIGKLIMAIGFLFTGPSYFYNFPDSIAVLTVGICILGFSASFNIIPLFPLMMREVKFNFIMEGDAKVSDLASGLYTASFGLGAIAGPLTGVYLEWLFGFRITTDILSMTVLLLLAVMLLTGEYKKMKRSKLRPQGSARKLKMCDEDPFEQRSSDSEEEEDSRVGSKDDGTKCSDFFKESEVKLEDSV